MFLYLYSTILVCIQCRGVSRKTQLKCSLDLPSKVLTKHVLSGLAATLIFISPANQVCIVFHNLIILLFHISDICTQILVIVVCGT
jgi:hypothetical protein